MRIESVSENRDHPEIDGVHIVEVVLWTGRLPNVEEAHARIEREVASLDASPWPEGLASTTWLVGEADDQEPLDGLIAALDGR